MNPKLKGGGGTTLTLVVRPLKKNFTIYSLYLLWGLNLQELFSTLKCIYFHYRQCNHCAIIFFTETFKLFVLKLFASVSDPDPDPHQNETDPKHCFLLLCFILVIDLSTLKSKKIKHQIIMIGLSKIKSQCSTTVSNDLSDSYVYSCKNASVYLTFPFLPKT